MSCLKLPDCRIEVTGSIPVAPTRTLDIKALSITGSCSSRSLWKNWASRMVRTAPDSRTRAPRRRRWRIFWRCRSGVSSVQPNVHDHSPASRSGAARERTPPSQGLPLLRLSRYTAVAPSIRRPRAWNRRSHALYTAPKFGAILAGVFPS
jgi:hypothetical protein